MRKGRRPSKLKPKSNNSKGLRLLERPGQARVCLVALPSSQSPWQTQMVKLAGWTGTHQLLIILKMVSNHITHQHCACPPFANCMPYLGHHGRTCGSGFVGCTACHEAAARAASSNVKGRVILRREKEASETCENKELSFKAPLMWQKCLRCGCTA